MVEEPEIFDFAPSSTVRMRDYQGNALNAVREAWKEASRLLMVMATGTGKTEVVAKITKEHVDAGGKVLILAHTDELLDQMIFKVRRSTDLEPEKEKADEQASPFAPVVVASVQTLARENRLTGFADNHFTLIIVDECHRSLAASYQRILCYFHFGAKSLAEDWKMPVPGEPFLHNAKILGVTATADRGDKRSLGEFYQKVAFEYGLLEAVRDGYLVRPIVKNIPIKIDLKGIKRTAGDFDAGDVAERIRPFLKAGATAIKEHAGDRKTVAFMPSIETARMLAEACSALGLNGSFVSGQCADRSEKVAAFDRAPAGAVIACAMLLIEGWDCDTVSAVAMWRVTKVRSLFAQGIGRCTRTLTGLIDGLETADERLAAIKLSSKPDMLILDPLWLTDRLDLIRPVDLVAGSPAVREKMLSGELSDLVEAEAAAERDLLASLEAAAKKHSRKATRIIDPLAWAVSLGDASLAGWEPDSPWDELPPHPGQLEILTRNSIDTANITCRGLASKIVDRIVARKQLGLCSPKQMRFLIQLGMKDEDAALTTEGKAGAIIGARARSWR